jgi:hypothetical protein
MRILLIIAALSLCGCNAGLRYGLVTQPHHKGYGQLELTLVDVKFSDVLSSIIAGGQ